MIGLLLSNKPMISHSISFQIFFEVESFHHSNTLVFLLLLVLFKHERTTFYQSSLIAVRNAVFKKKLWENFSRTANRRSIAPCMENLRELHIIH